MQAGGGATYPQKGRTGLFRAEKSVRYLSATLKKGGLSIWAYPYTLYMGVPLQAWGSKNILFNFLKFLPSPPASIKRPVP